MAYWHGPAIIASLNKIFNKIFGVTPMSQPAVLRPHSRVPGLAPHSDFGLTAAGAAFSGTDAISTTNTISTQVTATVMLGSGQYGDSLKVTKAGSIAPTAYGEDGVLAPASLTGVVVINHGSISGGVGTYGSALGVAGGIGVDIQSAGILRNTGIITGGEGAAGRLQNPTYSGGVGGRGTIAGGAGGRGSPFGGNGGDGVDAAHSVAITNHGTIAGGVGGFNVFGSAAGSGGIGIKLDAGGSVFNSGTILGGLGANGEGARNGAGGIGVLFASGGSITNAGTITGGAPYFSQFSGGGGAGGVGVEFGGEGVLINRGAVAGGAGVNGGYRGGPGTAGGDGVDMFAGGLVSNTGSITGGAGGGLNGIFAAAGGIGVYLNAGAGTNSGTITGGAGGIDASSRGEAQNSGVGGVGVKAISSTFENHGLIAGGEGGTGGAVSSNLYTAEGDGGAGVDLRAGASMVNFATIAGGEGGFSKYGIDESGKIPGVGGAGGTGLQLESSSSAINKGLIIGGAGGYVQDSFSIAGAGGTGADLTSDAGMLTNSGVISGGTGGAAYDILTHSEGTGASGGIGVDLAGGDLTNTGTITGGAGGYGAYQGGAGGVGVYVDGGTMVTSGTIDGGAGGHGGTIDGAAGAAVKFGTIAGTLVIDADARFNGAITADSAAHDTLVLGGAANGALSGFGTSVTGFTAIDEAAHAHWTLSGTIAGVSALTIGSGATLALTGPVSAGAIAFTAGGGETLKLEQATDIGAVFKGFGAGDVIDLGKLQVSAMTFLNGTLTLMDGASVADTLRFGGAYTAADFVLHADGAGGTDIAFAEAARPTQEYGHGAWIADEVRWDVFGWLHG
jgi:hypothetical protein